MIPDPVPDALSTLTAAQVQAYDDAWAHCIATLPDGFSFDDMQSCLADTLAVPADDATLQTFLQWAVDQTLVPARPVATPTP